MKVILELTNAEAEKLSEQMEQPDTGCCEDMWCSAELTYLRDKIDKAIEIAKKEEELTAFNLTWRIEKNG
jgi:hypothetical protein